jgi:predicted DNA-binding protein YlxM (UPF0122 family)
MDNKNYINDLVEVYQQLSAAAEQAEREMKAEGASDYSCGIQAGIAIAYSVAATRLYDTIEHQRQMDAIKEAFAV